MVDEARLYQAIGRRIRQLRMSQAGATMTQAELASLVGLERTSITNIEKGNQKVSLHALYRICEVLKVSVAEALPQHSDVQSDAVPTEEFPFANQSVEATPLVRQAVFEVLNRSS
ncbi:helix-turn-helix domain-containing protein [Variovorax sp. Root434]|uniref:helix-turn-helix domain-containing protein n=1 Tax=Variovorax sp. Root434 TaxID=1736536 RepID=UPI0009EB5901|nr:helix-turn-helix transcriptional regulator [Variovorax sp. Root434]